MTLLQIQNLSVDFQTAGGLFRAVDSVDISCDRGQATLSFSNAILDAAALGFLGMGAQPPLPA